MIHQLRIVTLSILLASAAATPAVADPVAILPLPASIKPGIGAFTVVDGAAVGISAGDSGAAIAARLLIAQVMINRGLTLVTTTTSGAPIRLIRDPGVTGAERYTLTVGKDGIGIAASTDRGLLYGAMSLAQLLSPDRAIGKPVVVPALTIDDAPRFGWRGLMIDPARHFLPMPALRRIVDQMATVKLNTLHLHLSDDQGWRVEIKRYPKLTGIGAWRTLPSSGGKPVPDRYGGFYTQAELKALVAYAGDRGITIVPELDLPGHAQALVAAYPEFGVFGDRPAVSGDWGIGPYLLNPDAKGVAFVKEVLDELMAIFPGTYIHLGGDEAVKDQWQRSPAVQAQIRALGLKDENQLQSWLIDQFGEYLASKGRRLIGWDEILEGGLPQSASVMSWRGDKGAIDAANQDHDVVLSPAPTLYFDNAQSDRDDEPPGRLAIQTLADVYRYDPMPVGLDPSKAGHILGAQANNWSELLVTPDQVQHAIFPRAAAIAEISWSRQSDRDFAGFVARLDPQIARWTRAGIAVADSAYAVTYAVQGSRGAALRANRIEVALSTQVPGGTIRYTLDGSPPTPRSPAYAAPLSLPLGTIINAVAFGADDHATAAPRRYDTSRIALLTNVNSALVACPRGALGLRVPLHPDATTNAPTFNVNVFDTCAAYPAAPLDIARGFTIDVARLTRNYGLAHEITQVRPQYNVTTFGELIVMIGCPAKDEKPVIAATFPLPDPAIAPNRFSVTGRLPAGTGDKDLCLQFTAPTSGPFYAVERVALLERSPVGK